MSLKQISTGTLPAYGTVAIVNNCIDSVAVSGGSGYTVAPTVTLSGDVGNGDAALTAVLSSSGSVMSVSVSGSGTGYTFLDHLTFSGGSGTGAAGFIFTNNGNIIDVVITAGGSGYTSAPTVGVATSGGSGNTLTAHVGKAVASVTVAAAGTGFLVAPTLTFGAPAIGTTATGTATMESVDTAVALDLYAPVTDGNSLTVFDTIGADHTITTVSVVDDEVTPTPFINGGTDDLLTFGGTAGDSVTLTAFQGVWYATAINGVTVGVA